MNDRFEVFVYEYLTRVTEKRFPSWDTPDWLGMALVIIAIASIATLVVWPRTIWKKAPGVLISVLGLAIIFAAGEVYLRIHIPFKDKHRERFWNPNAGFLYKPGSEIRHTDRISYWVRSRVNSLGFADREPIPKPSGGFRIAIVGDSFVEALHVPLDQRIHIRLEELLTEKFGEGSFDTVAFGRSGTGQANQLAYLEEFGEQLDVDLVILLFATANDFPDNSPILQSIRHGWGLGHYPRLFFVETENGQPSRLEIDQDWKKHKLPVPRAKRKKIRQARRIAYLKGIPEISPLLTGWNYPDDEYMDFVLHYQDPPPVFVQAVRLTSHALKAHKQLASEMGYRLLVAAGNQLTLEEGQSAYRRVPLPRGVAGIVERLARELAIPFVDLYPYVKSKVGDQSTHFLFDRHWNALGHRVNAEGLFRYLESHRQLITPYGAEPSSN